MNRLRLADLLTALVLSIGFFSCSQSEGDREAISHEPSAEANAEKALSEGHDSKRPNVFLLVLDTARADFFSCYGHPRTTSPHIDALAAEGVRYDSAFATCFWTFPSHASLLTGLYPTEAGATSETLFLPKEVTTLAERLGEAGYYTGAFVRNPWLSVERGFHQGFDDFVEAWRGDEDLQNQAVGERIAVDRTIEWIDSRAGKDDPFFLFVNLNMPHLPYAPPKEYRDRFLSPDWPLPRLQEMTELTGGWEHLAGASPLDESDLAMLRELYEGDIAFTDELSSRLFNAFREKGILDDTVVIVTSDHGENIGEHGMIDHVFSMYDTTVRVPLILRYPPRFPKSEVCNDLVSLIDVMPTILELCDAVDPKEDALRFQYSLCNADREIRPAIFAENDRPENGLQLLRRHFPNFDTGHLNCRTRMVRTGQYKLINNVLSYMELFDLIKDPGEENDISKERKELRRRLTSTVKGWNSNMKKRAATRTFESRDAESLEKLRGLGYLGAPGDG